MMKDLAHAKSYLQ